MAEELQIRQAIAKGAQWLQGQQNADAGFGKWGQGSTSLATLALFHAGLPESREAVMQAVNHLSQLQPQDDTYFRALTAMTLVTVATCEPMYLRQVQDDADWLIRAQNRNPDNLSSYGGWADTKSPQVTDGVHTCYAIMGLYSATLWGVSVPGEVWRRAAAWYYNNLGFFADRKAEIANRQAVDAWGRCLAAAAWASLKVLLLIVGELDLVPKLDALEKSVAEWLADNYMIELEDGFPDSWYYFYLFNMMRGCVIFPCRNHLGGKDWYGDLADNLLLLQKPDGQWSSETDALSTNVIHTSFALLALSKANIAPAAKAPVRSPFNFAGASTLHGHKRLSEPRKIRRARFPVLKTLDGFDFSRLSEIDPALFRKLANCDFVANKENLVLIGNTGLGKTHLATGLGVCACNRGYKVRFFKAFALVNILESAHIHHRSAKLIGRLGRADLLIIDELSYFELTPLQAELLFQVLSSRHERASTIVTTNLGLPKWTKIWGNSAVADVVVGRIRALSHIVNLHGS